MGNLISYVNLLTDRDRFRKAGGAHGSEFGMYDTPTHKYFKIFFYFDNGDASGEQSIESSNGLLAPTWLLDGLNDNTYYLYNSAWSYLTMNNDDQRAEWLKDFVNLLSNISSEAPWYFSELSGLDSAVERKAVMEDNFTISATRSKITIKCLQDAADDRIGTLLDLYRSIVWDWRSKRMVLPANLRKFDMGILVFETPTNNMNTHNISDVDRNSRTFDNMLAADVNKTSYKYFELHNCEIDYNTTKSASSQFNNKEGVSPEYSIEIHFDNCYETRYNKFLAKELGDFIFMNANQPIMESQQATKIPSQPMQMNIPGAAAGKPIKFENNHTTLPDHIGSNNPTIKTPEVFENATLPGHPGSPELQKGWLQKIVDQLLQTGKGMVTSMIKRAVMGNLYTFSLTRIGDQLATLANGDILSTARNAAEYIRDAKQRKANQLNNLNIFEDDKVFVTADGSMGTFNNSRSKIVEEPVGNLNDNPKPSHYSTMNDINSIKGEAKESHYSTMETSGKLNEGTPQSHFSISNNNGTLATKKRIIPKVKYIGNLYEGNTIANNL